MKLQPNFRSTLKSAIALFRLLAVPTFINWICLTQLLFIGASSTVLAQINVSPLLPQGHYKELAAKSKYPVPGSALDTVHFPEKEFRRAAYLKLRTVYLNVPAEAFAVPPPPANSSEQTRAELDYLLAIQNTRTEEQIQQSKAYAKIYYDPFTINPSDADYQRNINSLFFVGRSAGAWFNASQLPLTSKLLQNTLQDATYYFFVLKARFSRPRPYHLEPTLKNLEAPGHAAYPSGHASASYINALLLMALLDDKGEAFLQAAYDMAYSREILGVHYPSDAEAGRLFASQFMKELYKNNAFQKDFMCKAGSQTDKKRQINILNHKENDYQKHE